MLKKKIMQGLSLILASCMVCGYTVFAENEHTLNYDFNGGEAVGEYVTTATFFDEVETPAATKEHYVLQGYDNGTGAITSKITHLISDVSLKAVWSPEVYKVDFYDGEEKVSATNYAYGSETELSKFSEAIVEKHPYEDFKGWEIDEEVKTSLSDTDFGNKKAVAKFEGKTYNITYDLYDGTADGLPESYIYGKGIDSIPEETKDGKIFDGWFSDEACTEQVTSIASDTHGDIHLYAGYHDAPTTTGSSGTSRRGSNYSFSGSSGTSTSYDTSVGVTIPRMGYHVDNVIEGGGQAAVDAVNTGCIDYYPGWGTWYKPDGSKATIEEQLAVSGTSQGLWDAGWTFKEQEGFYYYVDHASQGLAHLGDILVAGDVCYINGTVYTYSGIWDSDNSWPNMPDGTRLIIQTCKDGGGNYLCYFY